MVSALVFNPRILKRSSFLVASENCLTFPVHNDEYNIHLVMQKKPKTFVSYFKAEMTSMKIKHRDEVNLSVKLQHVVLLSF